MNTDADSSMLDSDEIIAMTRKTEQPWFDPGEELSVSPLPGGGSDRKYWRIKTAGDGAPERSAIFMHYTDARPDNLCFASAADALDSIGVAIPEIYSHDTGTMAMWLEDLGTIHLWDYRHDPWEIRKPLYESTLKEVAKIHATEEAALEEETIGHLQPSFDDSLYLWEQNYFFEWFLMRFSLEAAKDVTKLREAPELERIRSRLAAQPRRLVHRDFQSQNVLVRDGVTYLIDFQGLRFGRPEYDIASLLYDPYVTLEREERESLSTYYFELATGLNVPLGSPEHFRQNLADCAVQRLMQALGAYAFLSTRLGKTQFLRHVPSASATICELAEEEMAPARLAEVLAPDAVDLS